MATALNIAGNVWLVLAFIIIVTSYVFIGINRGISALWDILSPFNFFNLLAVVATLLPGIGMKVLASKIRNRNAIREYSQKMHEPSASEKLSDE